MVLNYEQAIRNALREGRLPRLYLDTNVILDTLRPERRQASLEVVRESYARRCESVSSYFAVMEALDTEQENAWAGQKIRSKHDFDWIVRRRRRRNLRPGTRTRIVNRFIRRFVDELENAVSWIGLEAPVWEEAVRLAAKTDVTATDCIHIATAVAQECDVLVTGDEGLIGLAQEHIPAAEPEQVLKTLKEIEHTHD